MAPHSAPAGRSAAGTRPGSRAGARSAVPPGRGAPRRRPLPTSSPTAIPAHGLVATYATGPYAASPAQVAGRGPVLWIDVYGTDYQAMALDVEPSDATPSIAANWVWHRLSAHPDSLARLYTSISEWPAVQAAVATLPAWMRVRVRWWIADPTGVPHLVPGSDATQWYWGSSYDISTATPRF